VEAKFVMHVKVRFGSLADKPSRAKIQLCPLLSNSGTFRNERGRLRG
jgi:hypothetical protein